jgi:radical SAM superfamily enzyme YgiQ (UPF0313 family)
MRIQLIHPPIYVNLRAMQATRPSLPLGLAYVAAALREAGHEVSVLDAVMAAPTQLVPDGALHYYGLRPEEIAAAVDPKAEAIGIGALFSFSWPLVRRIIEQVKARHPDMLLIGGGEHFTGLPELSLRSAPLDYLVLGEGEETICELVGTLASPSPAPERVAGVAFLRDGAYIENPRRARIREVDALPWPAWDLFDPIAYYRHGYVMGLDAGMSMPILATRGCPYACTFCSNPMMWQRRWCARTPSRVVDEMRSYRNQYGAMSFPFQDLTAMLKKSWVVAFCKELLDRDLRITWQLPVGTRCEMVDEEVTDLLHRTGCRAITFAPESGSERTRKLVGKRLKDAPLMRAVRASVRSGLSVANFFVVGFPHDTRRDLWQSVGLAFRLALAGAHDIALSFYFPVPGSQLYRELEAEGRIAPTDDGLLAPILSMNARLSAEHNYCRALSAAEITRMKYLILLVFFATQFAVRPWRVLQLLGDMFRERENSRLGVFLVKQKRKWFQHGRD